MAYDNVLEFVNVIGDDDLDGLDVFVTVSDTSGISGSDCFADGPIPFTSLRSLKIHIPYLLQQCVAEFVFQFTVGLSPPQVVLSRPDMAV